MEKKIEIHCYICGAELKTEDSRFNTVFKYYNLDGTELGTVETYVCRDCMKV